ncbi:MAG: hypothetical protein MUD14_17120 [Hydrococcus sp. Prado102]|nr:hypothetical protein [Hydrococcus sp. Prado102]
MFLKPIIFLSMTIALCHPAIAIASEIDVQAGDVRITTDRDGDKYIYTRQRWRRYPYPRSHYDYDWDRYRRSVSCSGRGSAVRQETTQINRSGRTVTRSSTSTYCR